MELYKKYRPTKWSQIIGQDDAIRTIKSMDSVPHTILLSGPSGCGKTTIARILSDKLKCGDFDLEEINAANFKGIDLVRNLQSTCGMRAINGPVRVYILDECHQLTSPAQDAFLKLLEDTPGHVYFILCTTDPRKLKKTIRTRCTDVVVKPLSRADAILLLSYVCNEEGIKITDDDIVDALVEYGDGSPRKLLVGLNQIIGLKPAEMLAALSTTQRDADVITLARDLTNPAINWRQVSKTLKALEDAGHFENVEGIRHLVLGYARKVLVGSNTKAHERAASVLQCFRENFYDSGAAGLIIASFETIHGE